MPYTATQISIPSLTVGARRSRLSRLQVIEVQREINCHHPKIFFECIFIQTLGDKDQKTSLRSLEKTDFFTREIDDLILSKACRIAIHSAKDLPHPLHPGLKIVALTKGLDPSDSIIFKPQITLENLPTSPLIATSSLRREEAVKKVIPTAKFIDVRGPIEKRLDLLKHDVDGVVVAEAALIRLKLTHLNRFKLDGPTADLQGVLAIVAHVDDGEMEELFACIDHRQYAVK